MYIKRKHLFKILLSLLFLVFPILLTSCGTSFDGGNVFKMNYAFINSTVGFEPGYYKNYSTLNGEEGRHALIGYSGYYQPGHDVNDGIFQGSPILITNNDKFHSGAFLYFSSALVYVELKEYKKFINNPYMWYTNEIDGIKYTTNNLAELLLSGQVHFVRMTYASDCYFSLYIKWERWGAIKDHVHTTYAPINPYPDNTWGNYLDKPNKEISVSYAEGFDDTKDYNIAKMLIGFSATEFGDSIDDTLTVSFGGILSMFHLSFDARQSVNALNVTMANPELPFYNKVDLRMKTEFNRTKPSDNDAYWHSRTTEFRTKNGKTFANIDKNKIYTNPHKTTSYN